METKQIISIKEFRKIAGKASEQFSDEQIMGLILHLDYLADIFINQITRKEESDDTIREEVQNN